MGRACRRWLDAGRPAAPLARVNGDISHALFQLQTITGRYAAKRLTVIAEQWWWDAYHAAAGIEQDASVDGVSMPDRLPPRVAALDLDGTRHRWQLHRWCDGHNPTEPDDAVADWTGATLAVLHRRCGEELTALPDLHPLDSWHEWLEGQGTDFAQQVRQHLPTVAVALKHLGPAHR
jgi:hypothetical protein